MHFYYITTLTTHVDNDNSGVAFPVYLIFVSIRECNA